MTVRMERTDDLNTCRARRRTVFIQKRGVCGEEEVDRLDGSPRYLLTYAGETPAGATRLLSMKNTPKIARICVVRNACGTGLDADMIRAGLCPRRPEPGVTGAQPHAPGFYETRAFVPCGPPYDGTGLDHRDMERSL